MSAFFQDCGRRASRNEQFRMFDMGSARRSAFSFKSQLGIPSGPDALFRFSDVSFLKTECSVTVSGQSGRMTSDLIGGRG